LHKVFEYAKRAAGTLPLRRSDFYLSAELDPFGRRGGGREGVGAVSEQDLLGSGVGKTLKQTHKQTGLTRGSQRERLCHHKLQRKTCESGFLLHTLKRGRVRDVVYLLNAYLAVPRGGGAF